MHQDRKDAKFVKFSLNGRVFGVLVADTGLEQNHETSNTKQNYELELKLIN
jgi:hypothetical protein